MSLYIVVAKEVANRSGEVPYPVEWILLTDIKTETLEDAIKIISIYKSRWKIEQIFRLTKHKGFQLESSQLATGETGGKKSYNQVTLKGLNVVSH